MSRLWSQGHWDELSPECQTCQHRKTMSVKMDGNHYYCCGKFPLRVGDKCPKYEPERKTENALRLLLEWAIECGFGYDNIPEEYEKYKDEVESMSYTDGLIYIAKMEVERDV